MKLKNYKLYRSSGFPLNKPSKPLLPLVDFCTFGLMPLEEQTNYQLYQENDMIWMFNQHEYMERTFNKVLKADNILETIDSVGRQLANNKSNLIIWPIQEYEQATSLVFPRNGKNKDGILKRTVMNVVDRKQSHSIVTLSVMAVRPNGSLIDSLNFEHLTPNNENKEPPSLKVSKIEDQTAKIFQLNRQEISDWEDAEQIIQHAYHVRDYLEAWQEAQSPYGYIYQVSEVEVDVEYGTVNRTRKKNILFTINQYMKGSNLMLMRVAQALSNRINGQSVINTRDYPLMLYLSECFSSDFSCNYILLSQLGHSESIKEETINLSINLELPGHYRYLKNYRDSEALVRKISENAQKFLPKSLTKITPQPHQGSKMVKAIKEGEKVTTKLFYYETASSIKKRKPLIEKVPKEKITMKQLDQTEQNYHRPTSRLNMKPSELLGPDF